MKKVGIIIGSSRPSRISPEIADWLNQQLSSDQFETEIIDLAKVNLPFLDEEEVPAKQEYKQEHSIDWSKKIKSLDAVVLLFPQYNWSFPAVLKNAVDYLASEWKNKIVALASYGSHGGLQAQMSFNMIAVGLKMQPTSVNPLLTINDEMFDEDNHFKDINNAFSSQAYKVELLKEELNHLL
ncbi:NADPH-dependent FMN reductase [Apilactobacillus kunkeei]|uniref:NADPH-dependent FMN reductase n=1 Tax=Apilactobacillus kunkeei TaxID=148814 RepID=UPI0039E0B8B7